MDRSVSPSAFHPNLEGRIARAPDDLDGFGIYADWLSARGDPRGALGSAQVILEADPGPRTRHAQRTARALLQRHGSAWGAMPVARFAPNLLESSGYVDDHLIVTRWRGGFWHTLSFRGSGSDLGDRVVHPSGRLLRRIAMDLTSDDPGAYRAVLARMGAEGRGWPVLTDLQLGPRGLENADEDDVVDFQGAEALDLDPLATLAPNLRTLALRLGGSFALPSLPHLDRLDLTLALDPESVVSALHQAQPRLSALHLGEWHWHGDDLAPHLDAWMDRPPPFPLRELHIGYVQGATEHAAEEVAGRVRRSPVGAGLRRICLRAVLDEHGVLIPLDRRGAGG